MTTRDEIIQLADSLIREKGYNAFSFQDISKAVGIKTASIHYHFPAKTDLGVAVIEQQTEALKTIIDHYRSKSPVDRLNRFFSIYAHIKSENRVCLVGSLSTDLNTLDNRIKEALEHFSEVMLQWVTSFLEEGRKNELFTFEGKARTKAMMLIGNMMSGIQLSRLTSDKDFARIKDALKKELIKK